MCNSYEFLLLCKYVIRVLDSDVVAVCIVAYICMLVEPNFRDFDLLHARRML